MVEAAHEIERKIKHMFASSLDVGGPILNEKAMELAIERKKRKMIPKHIWVLLWYPKITILRKKTLLLNLPNQNNTIILKRLFLHYKNTLQNTI